MYLLYTVNKLNNIHLIQDDFFLFLQTLRTCMFVFKNHNISQQNN